MHFPGSAKTKLGDRLSLNDFVKLLLGSRELVAVPCDPYIQRGEQENANYQCTNQPTHDDDRERPLRIRADTVGERGRQQAETGHEHCHHNGTQSKDRASDGCVLNGMSRSSKLIDVLKHDNACFDGHTKKR